MKVGIVSDSHGNTRAIDAMLAHPAAQGVRLWFHAGDVVPDAEYLAMMTDTEVVRVAGNCDWPDERVRDDEVRDVEGHRIFLTHGHIYGVRYTTRMLREQAEACGADIAIYGHTHVAELSPGELTVLNPGSVARPRDAATGSFAVMELVPGKRPTVRLVRFSAENTINGVYVNTIQ